MGWKKAGGHRAGRLHTGKEEVKIMSQKQVGTTLVFEGTEDEGVDPFGREMKGKSSCRV